MAKNGGRTGGKAPAKSGGRAPKHTHPPCPAPVFFPCPVPWIWKKIGRACCEMLEKERAALWAGRGDGGRLQESWTR